MEFFSEKLIDILLYLQTAYAIWVFVRSAKFFKLPYVLISSFWHGGPLASLPFKRKVAVMVHDGPTIVECRQYNGLLSWVKCGGRTVVSYSESGRIKKLIIDNEELDNLRSLNSMMVDTVFTQHRDLLWPGCSLLKRISKSEVFQLYMDGYKPEKSFENCFIDQSSGEELNRDFMKLISVVPIYLQAKDENSASILAFFLIILFDFFSYLPNRLWQHFKKNLFYFSKILIAHMSLKKRKFLHVFLSTVSNGFMYSDFSIHKAYHTEACAIYVVEQCLLPSYVESVIEVDHVGAGLANKDGRVHVFEVMVNLNKHVIEYKYEGAISATCWCTHLLNDTVIVPKFQAEEEAFEALLSFLDDVKRMGIYPAHFLTEDGMQLIAPKAIEEELYHFRGLKVVIKKGVFVN